MNQKKMPAEALGFRIYLQQKNLAQSTQNRYERNVNHFLTWKKTEAENTTKKDILDYLKFLKKAQNLKSNTRSYTLNALKHYFNYLIKNDRILTNPTAFIKLRGTKRTHLKHLFSTEELRQLGEDFYHQFIRNVDDSKTPNNQVLRSELCRSRNYAMLQFMLHQGLTTKEMQNLQLADIDLIKAKVTIKGSLKSEPRTLLLQAEQIGVLMNYLQQIRPQFLSVCPAETQQLFISSSGKTTLNNSFAKLIQHIKTLNEKVVNFQQLRASVITNNIQQFGLRKAQVLAGHRYISSTEMYQKNDLQSLTEALENAHVF